MQLSHRVLLQSSFTLLVGIGLDQLSKWWVLYKLVAPMQVTDFFSVVLVINEGMVFGWFQHAQLGQLVLVAQALVLVGLIGWWLRCYWRHRYQILPALILIIAGGIGNWIDRFRLAGVVDLLDFHYQSWHFPVFNLADVWINLGMLLLIYWCFRSGSET
jgi:signal peptidase II